MEPWRWFAVLTLLTIILVRGPATRAENLYSSLKPFGEQARQIVGENPLTNSGEIVENLLFYLNTNSHNKGPDEVAQILRENPDTYLLIPDIDSKRILKENPGFKVILESNERMKWKYQLIKNFPPASKN